MIWNFKQSKGSLSFVCVNTSCHLPFMHFLSFPFLPLDFQFCKKLHSLFVYCLLEL